MMATAQPWIREEPVTVGRVSGVFGTRGWLRVESYTRPLDQLAHYRPWLLRLDTGWTAYQVLEARQHHGGLIVSLDGIATRDSAAQLVRRDIAVDRTLFPAPAPGEFYWVDLIGLEVRNVAGIVLGHVRGMVETAAHDVVRVAGADSRERLIPFVRGIFIVEVDLAASLLVVDWHPDD